MRKHAALVVVLLIADIVIWAIARFAYLDKFSREDLWQAQMGLAQGLLLVDTLFIVWVAAIAAERQVAGLQRQIAMTEREIRDASLARWQENKPVVFCDYDDYPERGEGNAGYVLRNVGGGFAVNIYLVTGPPDSPSIVAVGSLGAGEKRSLPSYLWDRVMRHAIIAEGLYTRTRRWNPTLNAIVRDGVIQHRLKYPTESEDRHGELVSRESELTVKAYVERTWPEFWKDLDQMIGSLS